MNFTRLASMIAVLFTLSVVACGPSYDINLPEPEVVVNETVTSTTIVINNTETSTTIVVDGNCRYGAHTQRHLYIGDITRTEVEAGQSLVVAGADLIPSCEGKEIFLRSVAFRINTNEVGEIITDTRLMIGPELVTNANFTNNRDRIFTWILPNARPIDYSGMGFNILATTSTSAPLGYYGIDIVELVIEDENGDVVETSPMNGGWSFQIVERTAGYCEGAGCCGTGTTWDSVREICIADVQISQCGGNLNLIPALNVGNNTYGPGQAAEWFFDLENQASEASNLERLTFVLSGQSIQPWVNCTFGTASGVLLDSGSIPTTAYRVEFLLNSGAGYILPAGATERMVVRCQLSSQMVNSGRQWLSLIKMGAEGNRTRCSMPWLGAFHDWVDIVGN